VGIRTGAVTWGFGMKPALEAERPDHLFDSVDDLKAFLASR
jgi:phosphoglycolate phosphatase-like HAD superfamily hydrolase